MTQKKWQKRDKRLAVPKICSRLYCHWSPFDSSNRARSKFSTACSMSWCTDCWKVTRSFKSGKSTHKNRKTGQNNEANMLNGTLYCSSALYRSLNVCSTLCWQLARKRSSFQKRFCGDDCIHEILRYTPDPRKAQQTAQLSNQLAQLSTISAQLSESHKPQHAQRLWNALTSASQTAPNHHPTSLSSWTI